MIGAKRRLEVTARPKKRIRKATNHCSGMVPCTASLYSRYSQYMQILYATYAISASGTTSKMGGRTFSKHDTRPNEAVSQR